MLDLFIEGTVFFSWYLILILWFEFISQIIKDIINKKFSLSDTIFGAVFCFVISLVIFWLGLQLI